MIINSKEINIDDLLDNKYMISKINESVYLSAYQKAILDSYKINYNSCKTMKELIFLVNKALEEFDECDELEELIKSISEFDYYHNTNK